MGYSDEKNVQMILFLLKAHGIKRIIVSPGATNVSFVASAQQDSDFELFSAYDERSAAYMAVGMAEETNEPVVLSCTGATASRNYVPALTEAYYKRLPIAVVTSSQASEKVYQYFPQLTDRSQQFKDMVVSSTQIPVVKTREDISYQETALNEALLGLFGKHCGPIHINLITNYRNNIDVPVLPKFRVIKKYENLEDLPDLKYDKIGIFIGAHNSIDSELKKVIENFCENHNAIVLCDHTSNYKGKYGVLVNLISDQENKCNLMNFDLIIHIGYVSGAYINFSTKEIWRVNPDGKPRDLYRKVTKVFMLEEYIFFRYYEKKEVKANEIYQQFVHKRALLEKKIGDFPFSNNWIAYYTANKLPEYSVLHLGILNSLRCWNHFEIPTSVRCYANTGGFGIDGCVSSLIGAAYSDPSRLFFGIVGDLAFYYDINSLSNEIITNNLRIMVINNKIGIEFINYNHRAYRMNGDSVREYIAAGDHNSNKNVDILKDVSTQFGFKYLRATNKEEYKKLLPLWLGFSDMPVLFEIFVDENDESESLKIVNTLNGSAKKGDSKVKKIVNEILPKSTYIKLRKIKDALRYYKENK